MKKIFNFLRANFTNFLLIIIAVTLLAIGTQTLGSVSVKSLDEVDVMLDVINTVAVWVALFGLLGVVSFIAITAPGSPADTALSIEVEKFHDSDRFDQMEIDIENMPEQARKLATVGIALLRMADTVVDSDSLTSVIELSEDLLDGVEEEEAPAK